MAGNRVGKTVTGCTEDVYHLTGLYPHWWEGKRFNEEIRAWVAGKSNETTRDIIQLELLGNVIYEKGKKTFDGTGLIPKHLIGKITWRQGVQDLADTALIKHKCGKWSKLGLKSYQQGRGSFEGTAQHLIHLDEEPPQDVYTECLTRTATTEGIVIITFTPLEGLTAMILDFMKKAEKGITAMITAGWDDAPHLSEKTKQELLAEFPEHEHDARSKGIPIAGTGSIYPVDDKDITVQPFDIPKHWVRLTGMDFGWDHPTAAVNLAWDRDTDIIYVVNEYGSSRRTPIEHAPHIRALCPFAPIAWPHDGVNTEKGGGKPIKDQYVTEKLNMLAEKATLPDGSNSVEASLTFILQKMKKGEFKIFSTCVQVLEEKRLYHRKDGKIVKIRDDYLDAMRYAVMMLRHAIVQPSKKTTQRNRRTI
ncbi:terminase large subunit domain-containing protein [Acinetobacter ursingii]|uniref:terminase large subunit domain-containing protein n=1 Tax=Acinetobacter ursingii TaxID=108980 RepID=UPI001D18237F|nr:terminase family protein [Acinetobacter ursingii]